MCFVLAWPSVSRAEDEAVTLEQPAVSTGVGSETSAPSPVHQEIERLKKLKDEDPDAFQREVQERKTQLRERLSQLKEKNPEAYQQVRGQMQEHQFQRLQHLREQDPNRFQQVAEQRRQQLEQRFDRLKATNPERYQNLTEQRRQWREEALERTRQARPDAYERFVGQHPNWTNGAGHAASTLPSGRESGGAEGYPTRLRQPSPEALTGPPGNQTGTGLSPVNRSGGVNSLSPGEAGKPDRVQPREGVGRPSGQAGRATRDQREGAVTRGQDANHPEPQRLQPGSRNERGMKTGQPGVRAGHEPTHKNSGRMGAGRQRRGGLMQGGGRGGGRRGR